MQLCSVWPSTWKESGYYLMVMFVILCIFNIRLSYFNYVSSHCQVDLICVSLEVNLQLILVCRLVIVDTNTEVSSITLLNTSQN